MGSRGLIRHVEGTARRPKEFDIENGQPVTYPGIPATEDEIEAKERKLDDFDQREYMARHVILSTVSPRLASLIKSKTAAEMWSTVKLDATSKSKMHEVDTKRQLQELRCDEGAEVKEHLTALVRLRDELEAMGASVSDSEFTTIILGSLPQSYRLLLSSVTHSAALSRVSIDPNDLMRIVLEESEQQSIAERMSGQSGSALYANRSRKEQKKHSRNGMASNVKCDNCGRTGHVKEDCFRKGGGKEGQAWWQKKKKGKGTVNAAGTLGKPNEDESYAFQCTSDHADTVSVKGEILETSLGYWIVARMSISAQKSIDSRTSGSRNPFQSRLRTAGSSMPSESVTSMSICLSMIVSRVSSSRTCGMHLIWRLCSYLSRAWIELVFMRISEMGCAK
jgi:hypothetical protein